MSKSSISGFFAQRPYIVSIVLAGALASWLGMGSPNAQEAPDNKVQQEIPLAKVVFKNFQAIETHKTVDLYGRTAPNKEARVGAERPGRIIKLAVDKGDRVKAGQLIASIDQGDLAMQLERAEANLRVREKEFKAAKSLKNRGLQGEVAYSSAEASLIDAKAQVSNAKLAIKNSSVVAPFSGIIQNLHIEKGDYVGIGDPVAQLIDLSKIVVEADVSERHIGDVAQDQIAHVRLLSGEELQGRVRFISSISSTTTNTFPIEVELTNPEQRIPAGVSAEVKLDLKDKLAIKVTPAMLALDESGNMGVKTLEGDMVKFIPIQLVKAEQDGVWLSGLGRSVDIITVGQGFVRDGDKVIATEQSQDSILN